MLRPGQQPPSPSVVARARARALGALVAEQDQPVAPAGTSTLLRVGARAIDPLALVALSSVPADSPQAAERVLTLPPAWPSHLPPPPPPPGKPPWRDVPGSSALPVVTARLAPTPPRLGPIWMHSTAPSFEALLAAMQDELRAQLRAELTAAVREELRAELKATVQAEHVEGCGTGKQQLQPGVSGRPSRKSWTRRRNQQLGTGRSRVPARV